MAKKAPPVDLLATAFAMIEADGWHAFGLAALAERAGVSLVEVYAAFPSRSAVLCALGKRADVAMLAVDAAELAEMNPRERLFEMIMRRLDALKPFRAGLQVMAREGRGDGEAMMATLGNVGRAAVWLADAAGVAAPGLRGAVTRQALSILYVRVAATWLKDDTDDSAEAMAELDKRLQQAESAARWFAGRRKGSGTPDEATAAAAAAA